MASIRRILLARVSNSISSKILTGVCLAALILIIGAIGSVATARQISRAESLSVAFAASKPVYAPGEAVEFVFAVANRSDEPVVLRFASAQRFEAAIEDTSGAVVRRWSDARMFAQMLGVERLGPGNPELRYEAALEAPSEPGRYRLRAWLADGARSAAASLLIEVRGGPAP